MRAPVAIHLQRCGISLKSIPSQTETIDDDTNSSFLMTLEALHIANKNASSDITNENRSKELLLKFWRKPNRAVTCVLWCVNISLVSNFAS